MKINNELSLCLVLVLLAVAGCSHSRPKESPRGLASDNNREELRGKLKEYAAPFVKVLTREVHLYHWVPSRWVFGETREYVDPKDAKLRDYLHFLKETFWRRTPPESSNNAAGEGLYLATEPAGSAMYGVKGDRTRKGWILNQFVFMPGTRILDHILATGSEEPMPTQLAAMLQAQGCPAHTLTAFIALAPASSDACMKIRNDLIRDLDLMAFRYHFPQVQFPRLCLPRRAGAIVAFDDRALNLDRWVAFSYSFNPQDGHQQNRLLIQRLVEWSAPYDVSGFYPGFPWPALSNEDPGMDVQAWARKGILDCGGLEDDKAPN